MKINYERFLDVIGEYYDASAAYFKAAADYRKKHGHGAYIDIRAGLDPEHVNIFYRERDYYATTDRLDAVLDLVGLFGDAADVTDARRRAWTAARALREWHERDGWQHCTPAALVDRLTAFIDETGRR